MLGLRAGRFLYLLVCWLPANFSPQGHSRQAEGRRMDGDLLLSVCSSPCCSCSGPHARGPSSASSSLCPCFGSFTVLGSESLMASFLREWNSVPSGHFSKLLKGQKQPEFTPSPEGLGPSFPEALLWTSDNPNFFLLINLNGIACCHISTVLSLPSNNFLTNSPN